MCCGIVYTPNLRQKTDADIIRDAKLEAMGLPPEETEHRVYRDRVQVATDELVQSILYSCLESIADSFQGHGAFQEKIKKMIWNHIRQRPVNTEAIAMLKVH